MSADITLAKTSYRLWKGESYNLTATHNHGVEWRSSDENIATVDQDGNIAAIAEGNATITARSLADPNIEASATIEVVAIKQIAAGYAHSAILDTAGDLYAAGYNGNGQLGFGDATDRVVFTKIADANLSGKTAMIALGRLHTIALTKEGKIYGAGFNYYGQLGVGDATDRHSFSRADKDGFSQVFAGYNHTMAIDSNGDLWATGNNSAGQLGDGTSCSHALAFKRVASKIQTAALGERHSIVLTKEGDLNATGCDGNGQLGNNAISSNQFATIILPAAAQPAVIAAGAYHSSVIDASGSLFVAGSNHFGQLGVGTSATPYKNFAEATDANIGGKVKAVFSGAASESSFVVVGDNRQLWAAGLCGSGQLGVNDNATKIYSFTPVKIANDENLTNIEIVAAGYLHALALDSNGALWGAGSNYCGRLGLGDNPNSGAIFVPIPLPDLNN